MTVFQHTRLMKGGENHCDILILAYDKTHNELRDHHPLRDEVMDDSALSVAEGAAGNETYGKRDHGVLKDTPPATTAKPADPVVKASTTKDAHADAPPVQAPPKAAHDDHAHDAKPKHEVKAAAPVGEIQPTHDHAGHYDRLKGGVDSFGNATDSIRERQRSAGDDNHVFKNAFSIVTEGTTLYTSAESMQTAGTLPRGTKLHVAKVHEKPTPNRKKGMPEYMARAQIVTPEIGLEKNLWINFSNLGGKPEAGAVVPFGNELSDAKDKARADAIRAELPKECKPGQSKFKWRFGSNFLASFHGTALDSSLMSKVNALMNWAIANDMVVDDIVIGEGMRDPRHAHWMSVRFWIARGGMKMIDRSLFAKLKDGKDEDGNLWYKPGWTDDQIIANAEKLYAGGGTGKVAAEGYNFGDSRRAPMRLESGQGVSAHCSGHAVDVGIPWRDKNNPSSKAPDLWGWEEIYHQFGLTRPLHKDKGGDSKMQEHWHVEETGKQLNLAYEDEKPPG